LLRYSLLSLAVFAVVPTATRSNAANAQDVPSIAAPGQVDEVNKKGQDALQRKDYSAALDLFVNAANQGSPVAQTKLGMIYEKGLGVRQDFAQATAWYLKGAKQGDANAEAALGRLMIQTEDEKFYRDGMAWLRKAADQGNAEAENWIGLVYFRGQGVPQDYAQAATWLRKAADQGNVDAQAILGSMYLNGLGVQKDYAQALGLLRKAAEQGNDDAQYGLGLVYGGGMGVNPDLSQAELWFRKAAAQGHDKAKTYLAAIDQEKQSASAVPPALQFKCFLEAFDPKVAGAGNNKSMIEAIKRSSDDPRYDACIQTFQKKYGLQGR